MTGIEILKQIIRQQTVSIGQPVSNLYGASPPVSPAPSIARDAVWAVMRVPGTQFSSLDEFYAAWFAQIGHAVTLVQAVEGAVAVGDAFQTTSAAQIGASTTYLARGSVQAEAPIVAQLEIETLQGSGDFIVYLDGVLQRRGTNRLSLTLAIDRGPHSIEVLGTASLWAVSLPPSVRVLPTNEFLDQPVWNEVVGGYVDAISAVAAVTLSWFTDTRVGGWLLRRRELIDLARILTVTAADSNNEYGVEVSGDQTAAAVIGQDLLAGRQSIGTILQASYDSDSDRTQIHLRLPPGQLGINSTWVNRVASTGQFVELARIKRTGSNPLTSYVDSRVKVGVGYDYVLLAFGLLDDFIVGPPSTIEYVRAGDATAPASIVLRTIPVVSDGRAIIKYTTPDDTDYAGVRVYYRNELMTGTAAGPLQFGVIIR